MATYDGAAVNDLVIAHNRGVSVKHFRQLRDNSLAIAEASPGAPVMQTDWHWFDQTNVDDGSEGLVYDHAIDGNVSIIESPTFLRGFDYEVQFNLDLTVSRDFELRVQFQFANTGAWTTIFNRAYNALIGSPDPIWGIYTFLRPMSGPNVVKTFDGKGLSFTAGARDPEDGPISAVRLAVDGVFDGGTFRMMQRREYLSQ